jgi:hypothetical protein
MGAHLRWGKRKREPRVITVGRMRQCSAGAMLAAKVDSGG